MNVEIESISSTSVTVSWGEPSLEEQNGVILAYFVSVVKDYEQLNVTTNFTAAYISRILISPLRPFSKHNLSVAAMNINGTGPYSAPIPFTTAQAGYLHTTTSHIIIAIVFLCTLQLLEHHQ